MNLKVIKNALFQWSMRIFMPGLAKQMQQEGTFQLKEGQEVAQEDYMLVEDRGAAVTIFSFSGIDVLFAGMGRFEFRKVLANLGQDYNLVFLRDLHRVGYHFAPNGEHDGLDFYTREIQEVMQRLGARTNIAMGSSSGGQAAFYFGTRCGMDGILAFGPAFPAKVYTKKLYMLQALLDIPHLVREPVGYFEVILVCIGAWHQGRLLRAAVGDEGFWNTMKLYAEAGRRPPATVFYGRFSPPDARQAKMLEKFPDVKLIALDTGRHNSPAYLKEKGLLTEYVGREVGTLVEAHQRKLESSP